MDKEKVLLLYSGGFDSTVLLLDLLHNNYEVELMFFNYNQKNYMQEITCATHWAVKHGLKFHSLTIPMIMGDGEYVHMRNLIMASYAGALAEKRGIGKIFMGLVKNEGVTAYPDTTIVFEKLMSLTLEYLGGIGVHAPFVNFTKTDLFAFAHEYFPERMKEILDITFSCNHPLDGKPCGKCGDCLSIEAYKNYNAEDLQK
jgi:7-cyano-7-deazaguanine synthase